MKGRDRLRVLLIGGDASIHVAVSMALGNRSSHIVTAPSLDPELLRAMTADVDVVVVTSTGKGGAFLPLEMVKAAGIQAKTLVLGHPDDPDAPAEAIGTGVRGYLHQGVPAKDLGRALERVAAGGAVFDATAAHHLAGVGRDSSGVMGTARALASALELKDSYTGGHAERVTSLAMRLATAALGSKVAEDEVLEAAFLLHDVGKIGIPESILLKPAGLTLAERKVLETHPILGETIIAPLVFPTRVHHVIRYHHERWDGGGYPDGLLGPEIPIEARIFAIADVIDAMSSIRPYRRPVRFEHAVREVVANAGSHFDPELAVLAEEVFLRTPVEV